MLNSFLSLQRDSEQDSGHFSVLDQGKSGLLSVKIVHKENGTNIAEKIVVARGMGSPRPALNRRRRTREGPELACVQTPIRPGGTRRGGRVNEHPAVGLPARSSGRHVVRRRQSSPILKSPM